MIFIERSRGKFVVNGEKKLGKSGDLEETMLDR